MVDERPTEMISVLLLLHLVEMTLGEVEVVMEGISIEVTGIGIETEIETRIISRTGKERGITIG